jgi:amino acid transporter
MGISPQQETVPEGQPAPETARTGPESGGALGAWDAVGLVVGIVVGVGIFKTPANVCAHAAGPGAALGAWVLGGLLSLAGALCYAELASAFPRSGGEYVYLTRAFGRWAGFLCAWAQLAVIRTGGAIAAPAYVFADYAARLGGLGRAATVAVAVLVIALSTAVNVLGVNPGRRTQNLLTALKVLALAGVILAGFLAPATAGTLAAPADGVPASFAVSMIMVLFSYAGWHEAAYVTAEVRDRRRNLPLALLGGTALVTLLYVLLNTAYLAGLGFEGVRRSPAVAADLLTAVLGPAGGRVIAVLVMLSALGSLHGCVFTGARIYRELGADHPLFAPLGVRSPRWGTPVRSLLLQAAVAIAFVLVVGGGWLGAGRDDPFESLVKGTAPVFWLSFLLAGVALFVFRARGVRPPFAVPLYPVIPLVFCGWCAYMLAGSLLYASAEALAGLAVLAAGLPVYLASRLLERRTGAG